MAKKKAESTKPGVMIYFEILPVLRNLWWWQRLAILEAIIYYAKDRTEPRFRGATKAVWALIQPIIDRDDERYRATLEARKKGGQIRGKQLAAREEAEKKRVSAETAAGKLELSELKNDSQLQVSSDSQSTISNPQSSVSNPQSSVSNPQSSDSNPQSANNNLQSPPLREREPISDRTPKKEAGFRAPSLGEVKEFASAEGLRIVPEDFVDYYTANGWLIGGMPIKDWKAVARRWNRREKDNDCDRQEEVYFGNYG